MNEQQLQQLVQEVAGMLQQGISPDEIAQGLVEQGIPEDIVGQIIQAASQGMQGGQGQPQGGQGQPQGGEEGGSVLEALAQEDPEMLAAIIQEWESMAPEEKDQIVQALGLGGGQPQEQQMGPEQGMAPQGQPTGLFG
jgi:hypothetical protein